jgi:hypothetical protein
LTDDIDCQEPDVKRELRVRKDRIYGDRMLFETLLAFEQFVSPDERILRMTATGTFKPFREFFPEEIIPALHVGTVFLLEIKEGVQRGFGRAFLWHVHNKSSL